MNEKIILHTIVKHLILEAIEEARSQSATRKVRDAIVGLDPSIKPAQKINRVYAPNIDTKQLVADIEKLFNTDVKIIQPNEQGSDSSAFPTLEFNVDGNTIKIVHAKGVVAGAEGEEKQAASIQNQLKDTKITLKIGKNTYSDIDGFNRITGNKKADFAFTSGGKEVAFIQHKSPTHQQMSGIKKFKNKGEDTYPYPEMNELVKRVREDVERNGKLSSKISIPITSDGLAELAVYGDPKDKGTPNFVEAYCIGNLELKNVGNNTYELSAPTMYVYPDVPTGANQPTLVATYRKGRTQDGIPNVRFGIYPASYAKSSE